MARLGLLMLRSGHWKAKPLIPELWCNCVTTLVTPHPDIHPSGLNLSTMSRRWGYGVLWWVWDAPAWPNVVTGPYQGAYSAMGAGGQYITVLPALDMVIAHKADIDEDSSREVPPYEFDAILQMVIASVLKSTTHSPRN
jgi:CubicO group peptidase (beta-lactamase class C family)